MTVDYTQAGTYARVPMGEAFDVACAELKTFITRLCGSDAHLVLERESEKHWVVVDVGVLSERERLTGTSPAAPRSESALVMLRTPNLTMAVRFMRAYTAKEAGATLDEQSIAWATAQEYSWRVPSLRREPTGGRVPAATDSAASESPVSQAPAGTGELASPSMNVYPIRMLEQTDAEGVPA